MFRRRKRRNTYPVSRGAEILLGLRQAISFPVEWQAQATVQKAVNVNSPDASAHRQRWDDSPSNLGGILSLLSMETTEARCHSLSSAITFHQFRKYLLESLFEFPKIAAAGQCLGPRDVNNLVDFGIDHRMS